MTRNKDFKDKVRARMAKTGERYATARAQLAGDTAAQVPVPAPVRAGFAGAHPETTALVRIARGAGLDISEAMALGLGGGLGGAYFVFEYRGAPPTFYVATRCFPQYAYGPDFVKAAATRLGLALEVAETTSKPAAAKRLAALVETGPVIAWVDLGGLGSVGPVPGVPHGPYPHVVTVSAIAGDLALVHDTAAAPTRIPLATLATARARNKKDKHRLVRAAGVTAVDRSAAIVDAIRACVAELGGKTRIKAMAGNFGIAGLRKWAGMIDHAKDKKGWPKVFARSEHLWSALIWGAYWIEHAGTGGGAFRGLYADFLTEAAAITGRRALVAVAAQYRALAAAWSGVARAMLPASVPVLAETRVALDDWAAAVHRGDTGRAAAAAARDRIGALRARADAELTPHAARVRAELAAAVGAVVAAETEAASALGAAVR